jgi:hypothetical protein
VFCPLTFWAAPSIIAKLPTLAALARGEFSELGAEATSERTSRYFGRVFSKLRRSISMENLAAMVIGAAYPGVLTNDHIMAKYLTKSPQGRFPFPLHPRPQLQHTRRSIEPPCCRIERETAVYIMLVLQQAG